MHFSSALKFLHPHKLRGKIVVSYISHTIEKSVDGAERRGLTQRNLRQ